MSTSFLDPGISAALWITVKASVLLGIVAIVQALLRRRSSAAARHLLWALAIAGVLLLPIVSVAVPGWIVIIRRPALEAPSAAPRIDRVDEPKILASSSPGPTTSDNVTSSARPSVNFSLVLAAVYGAGLLGMLVQLASQQRGARRLAREATEAVDPDWTCLLLECARSIGVRRPVRLLRSRERSMPMAVGTRRPAILIPAAADTWPVDRRRAVILHELAHVARYDCLTQTMAFAACAIYWFHPAVWWAAERLRVEREFACDDRVLAAGTRAREYAGHLLEIAYTLGSHRAPALAVSMARPRHLEGRMLAVLDNARNRSVPALRMRVAGVAISAATLIPLAGARAAVVTANPVQDRIPEAASTLPVTHGESAAMPESRILEAPLRTFAHEIARATGAMMAIAQDTPRGTWDIRPSGTEGTVHLRLAEANSSSGWNIPIERLEGLTPAQLSSAGGLVEFRLRRDAGTFTFDGIFRNGLGAGTFSFTPDANFPAELTKRGLARPTAAQQYQMARHDVGFAFLNELNKQGYGKLELSEVIRAAQHGVDVRYLRDMGTLGYRLGSLEPLITLRDHGVTPTYIRELAEQGYKGLSADDLRRARDHGISPDYVRAMRDAGYGSLPMDQVIKARDHGVSAEFVRELAAAGFRKLPLELLIKVRDHGVSPEYVRDMRQLGYAVPPEELIRARDHGVDIGFVRGMASLGYSSLPLDSLVRLRDHGVTPKYAQELKALGYDRLTAEDLVTLRDHGLTADRIRAANTRAGTRLPVDLLRALASGGMK